MKPRNERCPLQVECERKCKFVNHEQDCDYYQGNARPGYEIEEIAKAQEAAFDEAFLADLSDDDDEFTTGTLVMIPVALISPHPDNPRKDLGSLEELADSIKAKGILQNLTVVPKDDDGFTVIIGHRRLAASKIAGLTEVPCVIADMTPQEQFETMMVENVQRSDLTTYEQAEGFQMMLDLGGNVDEVSQKTGFSKTTVRNRLKLLELDKEKFQKAELRGGTLQDYLKLNEIKDPERRNRVLDDIGTANFNNTLKTALDDQAFEDEFAEALKSIQEADWCKLRTDESIGYNGEYKYHKGFDKWSRKPIERPKDLDAAEYIYLVDGRSIDVYRKGPEKKKEKTAAELKKESFKRRRDLISQKLGRVSKNHRELREEFIQNFTAVSSSEMDIETFAAKTLIRNTGGTGVNVHLLGRLINCPVIDNKYSVYTLDQETWNTRLFNQPLRVLLCTTYARLEYESTKYHLDTWDSKVNESVPKHNPHTGLDLIYEALVCLGYEMSEEEIQMQKGTHPLFKEAKELVKEYLKEEKKK